MGGMPVYAYFVLAAGWLIWFLPFLLVKRNKQAPAKVDRRARWGVVLQGLAYPVLWQGKFWARPLEDWRMALAILFLLLAAMLSWTSVRALGRQWRIDAGLNPEHQLVRSGAYRVVRHPIYTSMICVLLGTGFMVAPPLLFLAAFVLLIVGTEIRVRIEDALLASRFGGEFTEYQRTVPAYIPFLIVKKPG
jgi:protein-S-isoprenylcysteine O-methyltransferase Ste14